MTTIKGLDKWYKWMDSQSKEVQEEVKDSIDRAARGVQKDAKMMVPVVTHRLQDSIGIEIKDEGYTAVIGTNVEYAIYVEYGTTYKDGKPYMTPAYIRNRDKLKRDLKKALKVGI